MSDPIQVVSTDQGVILTTQEPGTDQTYVEITPAPKKPEETKEQYRARVAATPAHNTY